MHRCGYLAWWLWLVVREGEVLKPEHCPDGPHCGCDEHSQPGEDYDE